MSLQLDSETNKIIYRGNEVGEHIVENGRSIVRLNIEFEGGDDWLVPLSWFSYGLGMLAENRPAQSLLTVEMCEGSIDKMYDVPRFVAEKQVKRGGYVWQFHKTDADDWPSPLHGHDYEKGLKLDAITGGIFDAATQKLCKTLKSKDLKNIQARLRESQDFNVAVVSLIDKDSEGDTESPHL